ncbi:hypothetical protein ACH5RR_012565 [Cinchona calisaya]|uniref:Uncharacterized protein n=1 Tax=Cinchona calisaya TaxID=153742 RepID=A0ABD3A839_9GENT
MMEREEMSVMAGSVPFNLQLRVFYYYSRVLSRLLCSPRAGVRGAFDFLCYATTSSEAFSAATREILLMMDFDLDVLVIRSDFSIVSTAASNF